LTDESEKPAAISAACSEIPMQFSVMFVFKNVYLACARGGHHVHGAQLRRNIPSGEGACVACRTHTSVRVGSYITHEGWMVELNLIRFARSLKISFFS
jgi:hypothetical protein